MNKILKKIYILIITFIICIITSQAFAIDVVKGAQTAVADVGAALKQVETKVSSIESKVNEAITKGKKKLEDFKKKIVDKIDEVKDKINDKIDEVKDKVKNNKKDKSKPLSTMKSVEESAELSEEQMKDSKAVSKEMQKLFMAYPSDDVLINNAYREKAVELLNDTLMEVYVTVRTFDTKLKELETQISSFETASPDAEISTETSSDSEEDSEAALREAYKNAYDAYLVFEELAKVAETLSLLRAQYNSAKYILHDITPAPYDKTQGKSSYNDVLQQKVYAYNINYVNKVDIKFADIKQKASVSAKQAINVANVKANSAVQTTNANAKANSAVQAASTAKKKKKEPFGGYSFDPSKNSVLKFDKIPEPELDSAFVGATEEFDKLAELDEAETALGKAISAHNLWQALPSYRDQFVTYHRMLDMYNKAVENVKISDKCAVNYLSTFYKDPEKVWYGSTKPSDKNVTAYDSRKGISGLAYKSFQAAKALISEEFSPEMLNASDVTVESFDSNDLGSSMENGKSYANKKKDALTIDDSDNDEYLIPGISPSEQANVKQNDRMRDKLTFKIGAEIAQVLLNDQKSAKHNFGTPYREFPVWNDINIYVTQYYAKKYENIALYVKDISISDDIVDMINSLALSFLDKEVSDRKNTETPLTDKQIQTAKEGINSKVSNMKNALTNHAKEIEEVSIFNSFKSIVAQRDAEEMALTADFENERSMYEALDKNYLQDLQNKQKKIDELQDKIDDLENSKSQADAQMKQAESEISNNRTRMKKGNSKESGILSDALITKETQSKQKASAEASLKVTKAQIDAMRGNTESIEQKIIQNKRDFINKMETYEEKMDQLYDKYKKKLDKSQEFGSNGRVNKLAGYVANSNINDLAQRAINSSVKKADNIFNSCAIPYAEDVVNNTKRSIIELDIKYGKEYKFTEQGKTKIAKYHKDMINKLKNVTLSDLTAYANCKSLSLSSKYADMIKNIYNKALIAKVCKNSKCYNADSEFFVAMVPSDRDFMSPNTSTLNNLPPLREIMFFDHEDYSAVPKNKFNQRITKHGFLNKLTDVPYIWKKILDRKAFVEDTMSLDFLDDNNASRDILYKRGIFPCRIGDYVLNISTEDISDKLVLFDKKRIVYSLTKNSAKSSDPILPVCTEYTTGEATSSSDKLRGCDYNLNGKCLRLKDAYYLKAHKKDELTNAKSERLFPEAGSELGLLIAKNSNNKFYFTDSITDMIKSVKKNEDQEDNDSISFKDASYQRMQMNRNQFGDFLTMVDNEMLIRQSTEELKNSIKSLQETLVSALKDLGYELSSNVDLFYDNQYNEVAKMLENGKNKQLSATYSYIAGATNANNELLSEKFTKLKNAYLALLKDTTASVIITDNTDGTSAEFAESLVTAKVNATASKKYKDEVANSGNVEVKPYCAVYPLY